MTDDYRRTLAALARRFAFAIESRSDTYSEIRGKCRELIVGVDPTSVDRSGTSYRYGGFDALCSVISAIEEQTVGASTRELLLKKERARILNAVESHPGRNQRTLAEL